MMKELFLAMSICCLVSPSAYASVQGREVVYEENGTTLKGYIAYDDAIKGKRPGVLVVHEWWGQNEYARKRVRMLAELGYTAMAVDMYGNGKVVDNPDDAGKLAAGVYKDMPAAKARFEAAMRVLREQNTVDAGEIAAFGYCFGGGIVLNMARIGEDLKGVASFHGGLGNRHSRAARRDQGTHHFIQRRCRSDHRARQGLPHSRRKWNTRERIFAWSPIPARNTRSPIRTPM